jgi:copper(I)-binding protein
MTAPSGTADRAAPAGSGRRQALDFARAGLAPAGCGLVLLVLLATFVIGGGGGSVSRIQVEVTGAAVPMISFTGNGAASGNSRVYLTVKNLTGTADALVSASSPAAAKVELVRGPGGQPAGPAGLAVPAGGTVSLSPFGPDLVLVGAASLEAGNDVLLRLRFRHAGLVTVEAVVTPPGMP